MDEHGHDAPEGRRYLPTLAELIDRLTIVILKQVFIPENKDIYAAERKLIEHDIDIFQKGLSIIVSASVIVMLTNRFIWENESRARAGGSDQDRLLKTTHSINGVRNRAKNKIARFLGDREDLKTDSLAADLPPELGNWDIV